MSEAEEFLSWVFEPGRTADELFTVELLIEMMRHRLDWPFRDRGTDALEERMEHMVARGEDPAYRPVLPRDETEELARRAASTIQFQANGYSDRPVRDLTALRFFPALEQVNISSGDVRDLSPLAALPKVKWLSILEGNFPGWTHPLDFAQCGTMPELERLSLALRYPWPDLRAIARWPVREARFLAINILALAEVAELPAAELVEINSWSDRDCGLRDLRSFPAMPKVKRMRLHRTTSLEGIERYPTLLNLEIGGDFEDLEPLTRLPKLTALTLSSEHVSDLTPLTRMAKLRDLHFMREKPLDLGVLTDAPELRRVRFSHCAIMRTEVGALNAGLLPEEPDFHAAEPRKLEPLKFYKLSKENEAGKKFFQERDAEATKVREEFYDGDEMLRQAEGRVFRRMLHGKLNALLGRGWGLVHTHEGQDTPGYLHLDFKRYEDTTKMRAIMGLLRGESAKARFPWVFAIMAEPHGDMSYEMEQLKKLDEEEKEADEHWLAKYCRPEISQKEDAERLEYHEKRYEYLEREHLLRLREQQGMELPPLALPKPPPQPIDEDEEEEPEEEDGLSESAADEDDGGGVAIAPPPPAPPGTEGLGEQLRFAVRVYEDCVVVAGEMWADAARYNLGEAPVEWTAE